MNTPNKAQWWPVTIAILCAPGPPIEMFRNHWAQDYGIVKAILMEISTPGVLIVFPALAFWYWYAGLSGPDDPDNKNPN
jgi:hypothetical protein